MKKYLAIAAAVAMLALLILGAVPAAADGANIVVYSSVPLLVNGVLTSQMPATVLSGIPVSIVSTEYYTSQGERYTFQGWSDGTTGTSISSAASGTIIALWSRQILIQVSSVVTSLQQSLWLPYGVPYQLKADANSQSGNIRYKFLQWSGGETPYQTDNTVIPLQPMTLTAQYTKENLLTIVAPQGITIPGSGWYADGTSLVLQAPHDVYNTAKTSRQDFSAWESVGAPAMVIPSSTSAVMTITVNGPYTLQADYIQQYLVVANSPFGNLNQDWVNAGAEEQLNAPDTQAIVTGQEQFIFQRWDGMAGLVSPKVSGLVTQPLQLTAVYQHQYMVTLVDPYGGSGGGWVNAGTMTTIRVPATNQKDLFLRSRFTGFAGYAGHSNTLQVLIQAPMTITANYTTGLDIRVLGIIIAAVIILLAIWVVGRKITFKIQPKA